MADVKQPAQTKQEAPAEVPYGAQVQKLLGKAKRTPEDQAEFFYNIRRTHILFFWSSLAMLVSLVIMFWDDYAGATKYGWRDWKNYQATYQKLDFGMLQDDIRRLEEQLSDAAGALGSLERRIEKWRKELADPAKRWPVDIRILEADEDRLKEEAAKSGWSLERVKTEDPREAGEEAARRQIRVRVGGVGRSQVEELKAGISALHYRRQMDINFRKSDYMTIRWRYEEAEHHYREHPDEHHKRILEDEKGRWDEINETVRLRKDEFDAIDWQMARYDDLLTELLRPLNALIAEQTQKRKEYETKIARYKREKPQLANEIRNAPMLDFFDPTIKIQQVVLDNVLEDYHFVKIGRVDRCHTCHKGISNPDFAVDIRAVTPQEIAEAARLGIKKDELRYRFKNPFLRATVEHARGRPESPDSCDVCRQGAAGKLTLRIGHGEWHSDDAIKYTKGLMAHPHLDLYVSSTSPHALEKIGCTVCHEGDGRDTEFSRVVHIPNDDEQRHDWEHRQLYYFRELWERPMLPMKHVTASCRRCHVDAVELPGADGYVKGMQLYERAGCYACHRTDTYQVLPKDTRDPKLDPNRRMRRPGPPLTHVADKLSRDWAHKWVLNPKEFRLSTRMPRFFGQSNARTVHVSEATATSVAGTQAPAAAYPSQEVESVIAATIVEFLFTASQTRSYAPPPAVKGNAERGRAAFEQIGCRACHTATPDREYAKRAETLNADDAYRAPDGESWYLKEFAPNLSAIGTKLGAGTPHEERGRTWLYHWIRDPKHYFPDTRMPQMRPQDKPVMDDTEILDLVEFLMGLRKDEWAQDAKLPQADGPLLDYLVYEQLKLKMPDVDALAELAEMKKSPAARRLWFGRKMVQNFGCYSCHETRPETKADVARLDSRIESEIDWRDLEGIGVELTGAQPEGVKAVDRLDFGYAHIDELGNHRGVSFTHGFTGQPYHQVDQGALHPEKRDSKIVRVGHSRQEWIFDKLIDPRVYDGGKLSSKPQDELLKMPNFYFTPEEARLVTTFVLSLTDHDFPSGLVAYVKKRRTPDEMALDRGERLVRESNCRQCHRFRLDRFEVEHKRDVQRGDKKKEVTTFEWVEGRLKEVLPRAEVETYLKAWGLPATPEAGIASYGWTTDGRTLRHEPVPADPDVKDKPVVGPQTAFVLDDGSDLWLIDGTGGPTGKLEQKRRIRNHVAQEGGGIIEDIRAWKTAHAEALGIKLEGGRLQPGDLENRAPPMLRTQGAKTQAEWLFRFLKQPSAIRPALRAGQETAPEWVAYFKAVENAIDYEERNPSKELEAIAKAGETLPPGRERDQAASLVRGASASEKGVEELVVALKKAAPRRPELNVRMPTFGFDDEEAAAIVKYFWVRDNPPGVDPYPYLAMPERDPSFVAKRMALMKEVVAKVVQKDCTKCHYFDGKPPSDNEVGPDLALAAERLRPRWLYPWMEDPSNVYPGTTMTQFKFDARPADPPGKPGDDERRALVEALLNWHRVK